MECPECSREVSCWVDWNGEERVLRLRPHPTEEGDVCRGGGREVEVLK